MHPSLGAPERRLVTPITLSWKHQDSEKLGFVLAYWHLCGGLLNWGGGFP